VYTLFASLSADRDEIQRHFLGIFEALREDDYRRMRRFDGRKGSLRTYIVKVAADLFGERLVNLFVRDRERASTVLQTLVILRRSDHE
jgi:hypothetical protein